MHTSAKTSKPSTETWGARPAGRWGWTAQQAPRAPGGEASPGPQAPGRPAAQEASRAPSTAGPHAPPRRTAALRKAGRCPGPLGAHVASGRLEAGAGAGAITRGRGRGVEPTRSPERARGGGVGWEDEARHWGAWRPACRRGRVQGRKLESPWSWWARPPQRPEASGAMAGAAPGAAAGAARLATPATPAAGRVVQGERARGAAKMLEVLVLQVSERPAHGRSGPGRCRREAGVRVGVASEGGACAVPDDPGGRLLRAVSH